ncbi:MAG: FkbM family methyltransferase [Pseudomonadota bacterium]
MQHQFDYNYDLARKLGLRDFARFKTARSGAEVPVTIWSHDVVVRKGTPDILVAVHSLTGEFKALRGLLPDDFDGVIVDAGGYIGTATLALRKLYPKARIIVLEPSEANLMVLRQNLAGVENVQIVHGALVGKERASITLLDPGKGEHAFTAVERPKTNENAAAMHEAPAYTLSQLVEDGSEIGILKLDIEGGEVDVLEHDMETLRGIKAVFAELHDRINDGCTRLFTEFSQGRVVVRIGEKRLSVKP